MKALFSALVLGLLLVIAPACSTPKPPTAPAAEGSKVIASLKDMSSMYQKKNLAGFMNQVADDFKDRRAFADSIESVFSKYDSVEFTVQYPRMFITIEDKGVARATFNWDSGWSSGGSVLKNSGRATFVFEPKEGRLTAIEGKNPFIPQAIEAPGK